MNGLNISEIMWVEVQNPKDIEFECYINKWTSKGMEIKVEFYKEIEISRGFNRDDLTI